MIKATDPAGGHHSLRIIDPAPAPGTPRSTADLLLVTVHAGMEVNPKISCQKF